MSAEEKSAAEEFLERRRASRWRGLWLATLRIGTRKDYFFFRCSEELSEATALAENLLGSSPGAEMSGARIVGVEFKGRLWN